MLARLVRIEGEVRGVARMVAADRYCIDVMTQLRAVRAAPDRTERELLWQHLRHCVSHRVGSGAAKERQRMIDGLIAALGVRG